VDRRRGSADNRAPMVEPLTASSRPRIFLLDGMALAYRAHFAMLTRRGGGPGEHRLTTAAGAPTGAVFGFLAALDRIQDGEKPEELVVVFDAPEPTFRHEAYADYKATREKMPEEMVPQLAWIRRAVEGRGLPFLAVPGYEADDVIGTLAKRAAAAGKDVWIVSGDKDMLQLVDERVRLYNVMKPGAEGVDLVGPAEARTKFGVGPERIIDLLGLMGDSSDNVPGVPGVGEKTALRLIETYGALEDVLARADEVPQAKLRENLKANAELARLSKRLVTIHTDVPLPPTPLASRPPDVAALKALFTELEFQGRLEALQTPGEGLGSFTYHTADTAAKVKRLAKDLAATRTSGGFVLDTETTGLDPHRADLVGLSFAWKEREAWYVPVNLDPPMFGGAAEHGRAEGSLFADEGPRSGDTQAVLEALRAPLEDARIPKAGQNMKYDLHVLRTHGVNVAGELFDTMVADFCADPASREHNLDAMALRRLGITKIPTSDLIGTGKKQITMREVPVEKVARYACEDADVTLRLKHLLEKDLVDSGAATLFRDAEMPLIPVLARMEANGIRVDVARLEALSADLGRRAAEAEAAIQKIAVEAGVPTLNVRSNPALGTLLFETLALHEKAGRKKPRRTMGGTGYATDEETLEELREFHPLPGLILTYRSTTKLRNTYVDVLPQAVNPRTGRIHTTFHPTGAATGRLSSSDPNLQNIPVRTEDGRAIRRAFVPEEGWKLLSADYSQIELRLLAHFSRDEGLMEAFREGQDVHRATAARVFKVAPAAVTPDLRSRAKAVNFGVIYGMGPQRLARETKVSMDEARRFIDTYFTTYPGVRAWLDGTIETARTLGYVSTLLGRRRPLPELNEGDPRVRAQAENVAMNTPLQGTAADVIKLAMIRIDRRLAAEGWRARMLLQVHDELVFEVPPDEVERLTLLVKQEMSGAAALAVPLVVDVGVGATWADAH
jgi:DNA polymerase I